MAGQQVAHRDYYNVLGVPREADADELKRAYRRLALKWHPDRNPGDLMAEVRFKHVNEAYRVLSSPDERARYDRLGPLYQPDGQAPSPDDLQAVVGRMWDNLFGRRDNPPGEDVRYTVSVSLEEVATGTTREVLVPRQVRCEDCKGLGARRDGRHTCPICEGSGRSSGARLFRTRCYHCDGRGFVVTEACATCRGEGRTGREDSLRVKVPPGVSTGSKLKVAGKGHEPAGDGAAGDLIVLVDVAEHPLFRRRGDDLVVDLPLTLREAALGGDVKVPTLDGTTTIRVTPGTPAGRVFRLSGRGLPRHQRPGRGDLHFEVVLEVPVELDDAERARLTAWADTLPAERHPRRAAFDQAVAVRR
ncbi:MAG: J domain-containing protein [Alphaproteobacteria bacterium]|nr:J domain-containing protein [Alphaproteobacteria bacterium]